MQIFFLSISFIIVFSGCSTKEFQLFQNENLEYMSESRDINISYDSKIVPDDILQIDIYNMNQKSNILKNSTLLGISTQSDSQYIVTADGSIYLPLLKEVKVSGLTVKQLNHELIEKYKKYLKQPYVKAKIKNHKVYVFGEVRSQGVVPLQGNTISLIEVISLSGGLSDYALRNRIHVISKEAGVYKIKTLDLTKLSTLNLDNLMLKDKSIVYVEPRSSKPLKVALDDYLPILQIITNLASTFLTIDFIVKK